VSAWSDIVALQYWLVVRQSNLFQLNIQPVSAWSDTIAIQILDWYQANNTYANWIFSQCPPIQHHSIHIGLVVRLNDIYANWNSVGVRLIRHHAIQFGCAVRLTNTYANGIFSQCPPNPTPLPYNIGLVVRLTIPTPPQYSVNVRLIRHHSQQYWIGSQANQYLCYLNIPVGVRLIDTIAIQYWIGSQANQYLC